MVAEIGNDEKIHVKLKSSVETLNAKIRKSGSLIKVGRYSQKEKDRDREGHYEGTWNHPGLPRSQRPLGPEFCSIRNKFPWSGSSNELNHLVKEMRLRYPNNYRVVEKRGELIPVDGDAMDRLTNYNDPIFNHPDIRGFSLKEGDGILTMSNPLHKFIYLAKKNELTSSTEEVNRAGALLQFRNLKVRNKKNGKAVKTNLKAASLLNALADNDAKLMKIAAILNVPGVSPKSDANLVLGVFDDIVIRNVEKNAKDFDMNYRQAFIYLAELEETDLNVHYSVYQAVKSRKLIKNSKGYDYHFEGKVTHSIPVLTKKAVYDYLLDEKNVEFYIEFMDRIK